MPRWDRNLGLCGSIGEVVDNVAFGDNADRCAVVGDDHARVPVLFHGLDDLQKGRRRWGALHFRGH